MSNEIKKPYVLLDWGGNVEDEKAMTDGQAKKENEYLWSQPRFLRWALKQYYDRK